MNPDTSPATVTRTSRRRVLVVDDNEDIADSLQQILELLQQDVRIAFDGETALRIASEFHPDLVFLDLGLPVMDGYEVARELRMQPGGSAIQIIALSGWGDAKSRARSAAAGFDQHWLKPIALKELRAFFADSARARRQP